MSLMNQFGLPSPLGVSSVVSPCSFGSFKSSEATSLCLQAFQQVNQGSTLSSAGNFTGSRTVLQNGASLWNQAISTETSKGASLQQGAMLGGYGSLLLGIGAIITGVAAIVFALKRRESQAVSTPASR